MDIGLKVEMTAERMAQNRKTVLCHWSSTQKHISPGRHFISVCGQNLSVFYDFQQKQVFERDRID